MFTNEWQLSRNTYYTNELQPRWSIRFISRAQISFVYSWEVNTVPCADDNEISFVMETVSPFDQSLAAYTVLWGFWECSLHIGWATSYDAVLGVLSLVRAQTWCLARKIVMYGCLDEVYIPPIIKTFKKAYTTLIRWKLINHDNDDDDDSPILFGWHARWYVVFPRAAVTANSTRQCSWTYMPAWCSEITPFHRHQIRC